MSGVLPYKHLRVVILYISTLAFTFHSLAVMVLLMPPQPLVILPPLSNSYKWPRLREEDVARQFLRVSLRRLRHGVWRVTVWFVLVAGCRRGGRPDARNTNITQVSVLFSVLLEASRATSRSQVMSGSRGGYFSSPLPSSVVAF